MAWFCGQFSSPEAAAWTQALGTIIAIAIAIWAPIWHARHTDRRRTATEVNAILAIAEHAVGVVNEVAGYLIQGSIALEVFDANDFQRAAQALRAIRLHELREHRLATPVVYLVDAIERLSGAFEQRAGECAAGFVQESPMWREDVDDAIDLARCQLSAIRDVAARWA